MFISLSSCSWLDVNSKSEVSIEDMFSTREGYYTTLSGIYISMGGENLYGNNLCLYALEPLTQQYTVSDTETDRTKWVQFQYSTDEGEELISNIWSTMYNTIVNCNVVIEQLQKDDMPTFEPGVTDILLAEALGLRAYMYFDLIRMYNDSYKVNPNSANVPYKTDFGFSIGKKITTIELLQELMADLTKARKLLQDNDPIFTGKSFNDKYVSYDRTQRMNYYAVTALMARIEMFRENYKEAYLLADEIIQSEKFRFIKQDEIIETDIYGKELKVDRIFMPEMIFGLYTETVLTASKETYEGLTQDFVKSDACYEESDVRRNWLYTNPSANNKINLIRYQRSKLTEDASKYGPSVVPMLKLSEMYLIAAEATLKDNSTGGNSISLINKIKKERISTELTDNASEEKIQTEITHEYICDFKGEGQLFYYYKRNNMTSIDNGNYNGNYVIMKSENYKLPLPKYEQDFGYGSSN
nr:hypothetical protein PU94_14585 [Coprobacter secundus]